MKRRVPFTAVCLIAVCMIACRKEPAAALAPLPDLTGLDQSLQQQVRTEYGALERVARSGSTEERAEAHGRVGTALLSAERYNDAETFLAAARALNANDMRWPYYLGHVDRARQQPETAAAHFEQARRLDPRHVPTLIWLGDTYLTLGRPDAAEPHLTAAIEIQPASVAAWFRRGRAALARRDYSRAIGDLEHARSLAPASDPIRYQLGLAYRATGDTGKAAEYLKRPGDAASVVPDDPLMDTLRAALRSADAYVARGLEAIERRDWPEAVVNLRTATELSPRDAAAHLNLGTALFLSGDREGARRAFESAVTLAPDLPKPRYTLGLLAESERRDAAAIEQFTTAVRLDPDYVEAHASLADALRRTGQVEASLAHYLKVLSIDPAASAARLGYGMGLVRLGRYRDARRWFEQAASMHADQPGFSHALARLLAAAPDAAVRDGRRAVQVTEELLRSHHSWTLLETRAMAAAELGDFGAAMRFQQEAIQEAGAAGQGAAVAHMETMLASYRSGAPCRIPWRDGDPVHAPRPAP